MDNISSRMAMVADSFRISASQFLLNALPTWSLIHEPNVTKWVNRYTYSGQGVKPTVNGVYSV